MSSFTGTQQKCKACEKTVYPVELLSADGVSYHKSCFKCTHCKSRLQVSSSSLSISVLVVAFGCMIEFTKWSVVSISRYWWSQCVFFLIQLSRYSSMEGVLYCKPHYEQLFKESGSFTKNFQSRMYFSSSSSSCCFPSNFPSCCWYPINMVLLLFFPHSC